MTTVSEQQWRLASTALAEQTRRFAELVRSTDPATMCTAHWSVADTLAHVASLAWYYVGLVDREHPPLPVPGFDDYLREVTVDTVADMNDVLLTHLAERRPEPLLDRLCADVDRVLAACAGRAPDETVRWVGDARVPLAGLYAHLVNELLIHGYDVARATGRPWSLPGREAALYLELFMVGVVRHGYGRLVDGGAPPSERRIVVEFRSAYTEPVRFQLLRGRVSFPDPSVRPDVRIDYDPGTLNLVMFGRVSKVRAVLTGGMRVGGRRPWLLPAFLRKFRNPS
ncbi:maleylpyruvate isomerase family mycothiol-dependent enzyme [Micromonospora sp. WMMD1082]|uniref:maleylpyruvate isomerase family mycothiol-dependent enzyme n=1 Tax=Micromonospora sp. WMMD1082 TaxID=3016104 RepID=UPI002416BB66|nr:maleylpyruvate isomerase family mycothiol-dependent enzyme [Micromonospora sp. WMMD1082]MDG4793953.1 maleylpyruvate isomerase family mycothiol-dependent enzyme [Micromonospora sp. WMMD1082]